MKRVGIALGSGGAKGLSHIAFIKALDDLKITPSVISGSSIGAVVGAFYAAGMSAVQMEYILEKIGLIDIPRMVDFSLFSKSAMLKGKGVEDFFYKHIPARRFEELKIPLKIVATDFWNRKQIILDSGELIPAIRASLSLPAIFDPVQLDTMILIDGGTVNPLPYDIIQNECDITVALDVSGEKTPPEHDPVPNMFESLMSTFQIMQAAIVKSKMDAAKPDIYIKPLLQNIRVLDFHRYKEILEEVSSDVDMLKNELDKRMKRRFSFFS